MQDSNFECLSFVQLLPSYYHILVTGSIKCKIQVKALFAIIKYLMRIWKKITQFLKFANLKTVGEVKPNITSKEAQETIAKWILQNKVCLFMKGTIVYPSCGYSADMVHILHEAKVFEIFSYNVLDNETMRQQVKIFSHWPTYPQLYVSGKFIGGYDILKEMKQDGSLEELLVQNKIV